MILRKYFLVLEEFWEILVVWENSLLFSFTNYFLRFNQKRYTNLNLDFKSIIFILCIFVILCAIFIIWFFTFNFLFARWFKNSTRLRSICFLDILKYFIVFISSNLNTKLFCFDRFYFQSFFSILFIFINQLTLCRFYCIRIETS